ncbi:MAG TPA: prepilin-type N-terminal cleavage/methylation domain-containing protein [Gemmataceae bacterium]|nr:prepilin-type N-terminal cleavage/methylation domain-containing protein [Gemmataceae bacterium]
MRARRSGFTLMELLLVLMIIVMVTVLSYPSLEAMLSGVKLQAAADFVVTKFADARAHAIEDQQIYRFAIQPGTGQFRYAPDLPELWGGDSSNGGVPTDPSAPPPTVVEDALPGGITFPSGGVSSQVVASTPDNGSWVTVLLFLPSGACSNDWDVTFKPTAGGAPIRISMRGLTGTVNVKMLTSGED